MRVIALLFILSLSLSLKGQSFERYLNPEEDPNLMGPVYVDDDGSIFFKIWNFFTSNEYYLKRIDAFGNDLTEVNYLDTGYIHQGSFKMTKDNNDKYLIAGTRYSIDTEETDALLIKSNDQGEQEWLKPYGGDEWDAIRVPVVAPDGGYALFGMTSSEGEGSTDYWMIKTDDDGEVQWTKTYGTPQSEFMTDAVLLPDGQHYIMAGITEDASDDDQARKYLVKINLQGELVWEKEVSHIWPNTNFEERENGAFVIPLENGQFYLAGNHEELVFGVFYLQSDLFLFDELGEVLWQKNYRYINQESALSVFAIFNRSIIKGDGIFSSGIIGNGQFRRDGFIMKKNMNGDSLWLRRYTGNEQYNTYFYDLNYSPDGYFVMSGTTSGLEEPINQDGYIVKVDTMGCLVPGCAVGVEEFKKENGYFKIGPNPARERLNIYFTQHQSQDLQLQVIDLQGKIVLSEEQIRGDITYMLDISHLNAGMYSVQLFNEKGILQTEKLVVE